MPGEGEWTDLDRRAALDIGHDLGRVILNARTFQREHELVVELQALDTYKSQLIATISHELKNPLTAVTGYLELLDVAPELSPASRSAVAAMNRGADRLSRVVEDLLLLAKVGDPQQGLIASDVDLARVVEEVTDLVAVTARRKNLTVDVELPAGPVVARGDATEIDRLVSNLVSNAVKYTPEGRRVCIRRQPRGRPGADRGRRRGSRDLGGRPGAAVRRVLPVQQPRGRAAAGDRPRPRDREADRRASRRRPSWSTPSSGPAARSP